jgi:hypothetical protein
MSVTAKQETSEQHFMSIFHSSIRNSSYLHQHTKTHFTTYQKSNQFNLKIDHIKLLYKPTTATVTGIPI